MKCSRRHLSRIARCVTITVALLILGCEAVPITGRQQLNLLSDQDVAKSADSTFSAFMAMAHKGNRVVSASESSQAAAAIAMIKRVSDRIITAAGLQGKYAWETVLVKAREKNAFVLPNGKIVVFAGLLPVVKSEAGMAAVIAHEVAHVVARHGAERVSQALVAQTALNVADAALAARDSRRQPAISAALGLGAQFGILLPFSREHELEADRIGLLLMAKAGYDPAEAIGVWERMEAAAGTGPWEFVSSHPSPETRRGHMREWLPEANLYYADRSRPLPTHIKELQTARAALTAQMALAPLASRPTWETGFWYSARSSANPAVVVKYRVESTQPCDAGECLLVKADTGARNLYTLDLELVETVNSAGRSIKFSPPLPQMQWPLRVGESWTRSVVANDSGKSRTVAAKGEVVGYETITVPAGTYHAYKIVVSLNGIRAREAWYSPVTRTWLRVISYGSAATTSSELVDYSKAGPSSLGLQ